MGPEAFQILEKLFSNSTDDVGLIKFFEMTIFAESSLKQFSDKNSNLSDFFNEYKKWMELNSRNKKRSFMDFIGIFKESAFVEILNRNGKDQKNPGQNFPDHFRIEPNVCGLKLHTLS
jgi:hypothetical protein